MDGLGRWLIERVVLLTSRFGISGSTFAVGDSTFVHTFIVTLAAVQFTLWYLSSGSYVSRNRIFQEKSEKQRNEILALMKERIDHANKPPEDNHKLKEVRKEISEFEKRREDARADKRKADAHAQSVQAKDNTLKEELRKAQQRSYELEYAKKYKEQELESLKQVITTQEDDDDKMTTQLENGKKEIDQLQEEICHVKKVINSHTKDVTKFKTELQNIELKREEFQSQIDYYEKYEGNEKINTIRAEQEHFLSETDAIISRVAQMEKALNEINSKVTEDEKEQVVNMLFDKEKAKIQLEETQNINKERCLERSELTKEIQLQCERLNQIEKLEDDRKNAYLELKNKKKQIEIKLEVLRDFHAKRDIKVREDLAREQDLRNNLEGDIRSCVDRENYMKGEIDDYKKIIHELTTKNEGANKERQIERNKVEKAEHESWLKSREFDRKLKDIEREFKAVRDQLALKSARKRDLETQIHDLQLMAEKRKQREAAEMARMRAKQEHDRKLLRMRGPQGERARSGQTQGPRMRGPVPVLQKIRGDSPQISPIHSGHNSPKYSMMMHGPQGGPMMQQLRPSDSSMQQLPPGAPMIQQMPPGGPMMQQLRPSDPSMQQMPPGAPMMQHMPPGGPMMQQMPPGGPMMQQMPPGGPMMQQMPPGGPMMHHMPPMMPPHIHHQMAFHPGLHQMSGPNMNPMHTETKGYQAKPDRQPSKRTPPNPSPR